MESNGVSADAYRQVEAGRKEQSGTWYSFSDTGFFRTIPMLERDKKPANSRLIQ